MATAAGPVLRELRRRFLEGRTLLGPGWRLWRRRVIAGAAAMIALMVVLRVLGGWLLHYGKLAWEADFLRWLGSDGPFGFSDAVFFQTFGTDITLIFVVGAAAGIAAWSRRPATSLSIVLSAVVMDLVVRFGWLIWDRSRPDVLYEGLASPGFHSFPSGHSAKTAAVYGLLVWLWLRGSRSVIERMLGGLILLFVLVVVPFGRMSMGVHWPSDVIAGTILGLAWAATLAWSLRGVHQPAARSSSPSASTVAR